jgi:hypothetical protein
VWRINYGAPSVQSPLRILFSNYYSRLMWKRSAVCDIILVCSADVFHTIWFLESLGFEVASSSFFLLFVSFFSLSAVFRERSWWTSSWFLSCDYCASSSLRIFGSIPYRCSQLLCEKICFWGGNCAMRYSSNKLFFRFRYYHRLVQFVISWEKYLVAASSTADRQTEVLIAAKTAAIFYQFSHQVHFGIIFCNRCYWRENRSLCNRSL